jgi:membrane fusion protein (multidrug efflux system)
MIHIRYSTIKSQLAILLPVVLLVTSCVEKNKKAPEKQVSSPKMPVVKIINPIKIQPLYRLTVPGELVPYEQVTIYPKIKGFVKRVFVDRGSIVKKG